MDQHVKTTTTATDKNSSLQERTYYQCFCMKNYQSYSALYLHVKNKHHSNLSFKAFRSRKTNWSGSIKNIIMQFEEEMKDRKVEPLQLNLRQRRRKMCFKQVDSQDEVLQQKGKKTEKKVKTQQGLEIYEGKNIVNVFELYTKISQTKQLQQFRKNLMGRLISFADRHFLNFMQENTKIFRRSYSLQSTCEQIPLMLNQFFRQECVGGLYMEAEAYELIRLSDWLYQNGFTTKLIVDDSQLKNICKVQETHLIKSQKLENE